MKDLRTRVEELVGIVKNRIGTDERGPDTDDLVETAFFWVDRYFESKGYTYYHWTQSVKPERAKLAKRGWFFKWQAPSIVDPNRRPPRPKNDPLEHDPVAKVARRAYIDDTLVMTPGELIEEARKEQSRGESEVAEPPANPREVYDHLVKIAPALQTRHLFMDSEKIEQALPGVDTPIHTAGYLRTAYWESVKTGEGLWVFTACKVRRRESNRGSTWRVWQKVKMLEKLAEHFHEPFDGFEGYEDEEVREALKELSWADFWASSGE